MSEQPSTAELYNDLREPLRNFIAKRVSDSGIVEDLVHDVFLRIHNRVDSLKEPDKLTAWIYQIARNSVIDYYRTRKEAPAAVTEELLMFEQGVLPDAAEKLAPVVRNMIEQLPDRYKTALQMADLEGRKHSEIAAELGLSVSAVKSRVQRGRRMLKDLLLQCCHFEFDKYGTIFQYSPRRCTHCCSSCEDGDPARTC